MPDDLTYACPSCGSEVRVGRPCPGCKPVKRKAAKPKRFEKHDEIYDGLDLPDEDFDYDEFVAREFGKVPHRKLGVKWYWWVLGVVILVWMIWSALNGGCFAS
ncbi:MAG TPA: hypothetical protein VFY13_06190 [Luteolibacter sp.]|nr:hypothetical protein [Luteolibacter sp.]